VCVRLFLVSLLLLLPQELVSLGEGEQQAWQH
jgi:hypothetical protein